MARSEHPAITVGQIRSIKPGETLTLCDVSVKQKNTIYVMVNYVKDKGAPRYVADYCCTYNPKTRVCTVTALGRNDMWRKGRRLRE